MHYAFFTIESTTYHYTISAADIVITEMSVNTLTLSVWTEYIYSVASQDTSPAPFKYLFNKYPSVLNILNMLHNLRFSLFKMPFIS
jgi:hypothetical protein